MQCDRAQEFFSDYLERSLDRPMTVALEAHLAGCVPCREDIEALRDAWTALEAVPVVEPPPDGAWQVMCELRRLRAERWEAQREQPPTFLERLRALNPFSAAMGAGLATLVIAGGLMIPAMTGIERWGFLPNGKPSVENPAQRPADAPSVVVSYGGLTPAGQQVTLQVVPVAGLGEARIQVSGSSLPQNWEVKGSLGLSPVVFPLSLPAGSSAEALRVTVDASSLGRRIEYLVVVPLGARRDETITTTITSAPLADALRQIAPFLGQPVVADASLDTSVSLQVTNEAPFRCLQEMASQVGAVVRQEPGEPGVYRLTSAR